MGPSELCTSAIEMTARSRATSIKFLSANDTGLTKSHQSGVLLNRRTLPMVFGSLPEEHVAKRERIRITWQGDVETDSAFTWYESKGELRLTRMGRGFPYLRPDETGSLLVLSKLADDEYGAYILETEDEIDDYLSAMGLGPQDAGTMFVPGGDPRACQGEAAAIESYVRSLGVSSGAEFPRTEDVSAKAREIQELVHDHRELVRSDPDMKLVEFTRVEYSIFREMESQAYGQAISRGFRDVDAFVSLANTVLNRRKSRAGKSFEHQLSSILRANGLRFDEQVRTEGNKRPDFVFPSSAAYHDMAFPADRLVVLAAKTTCKDRWRQILSEADRNEGPHFLATMQQGNTEAQLEEMLADNVRLVVPRQYVGAYPPKYRGEIWSVKRFIEHVRSLAA